MITEYAITECPYCGSHYASHLDACPRCEDVVYPDSFAKQQTALENNEPLIVKAQKGVSKQRSKKVSYLHYTFDSQKEIERYLVLKEADNQGLIFGLVVHPKYELIPATRLSNNGLSKARKQAAITYTADFEYILRFDEYTGIKVIEDVKGAYSNTAKNRAKGIAGKPIISEVAHLRHKLLAWYMEEKQHDYMPWVFRIVTDTNAPLAQIAK